MRRRLLLALAGVVIVAVGAAVAVYVTRDRFGGSVVGSSTEFDSTQAAPEPRGGMLVSPMFGGNPQRLHVGAGKLRPPYNLVWTAGGVSLVEFPPAVAFHYLYYATGSGNLLAVSTRNGRRLWTVHAGRCQAASPAVNLLHRGTVYESFLNRIPCKNEASDGELLAVAAGRRPTIHWRKRIPASESSPLVVGNRIYLGDDEDDVLCVRTSDGKTVWKFHAAGAVKGGVAYDRGRLFFGDYSGHVYALQASTGKLLWRASSDSDLFGGHGTFYSTPAVAYSRVYLGSTDGHVYSFGERSGKLRWSRATGGYVYGSPAVWDGRVYVGSYSHTFYALDAETGTVDWSFPANGPISGSATVVDGVVYFATLQRRTYGLDARTGRQVWSFHDGAFTPVVTDGQKLYVVGWSKIYAFRPRSAMG